MRTAPEISRRILVKIRAEKPCPIKYCPLTPESPQAIPAITVIKVPLKDVDILPPKILFTSSL